MKRFTWNKSFQTTTKKERDVDLSSTYTEGKL